MQELEFEVRTEKEEEKYGRFVITPLAQGHGYTIGNALRRVLLSSLKGAAVSKVKIKGVKHRFSTLKGLKEDILELLLNIKEIRFRLNGVENGKVKVAKSGPGEVTAGDIETPAGIEVVNKELILGTLADAKAKLVMELEVESGYGYVPFEEKKLEKIGVLPIDSVFSPIRRVNYKVEETRVGRVTNLDRLTLEVWTEGTVTPKEALDQAAKILVQYFSNIHTSKQGKVKEKPKVKIEDLIDELKLQRKITNTLKKADITTIDQLAQMTAPELRKIKNLGQKSSQEIKEALKKIGRELK